MKTIPVYTTVNLLSDLLVFLRPKWQVPVYTLYTFFEVIYFSWFLSRIITNKPIRLSILLFDIIFFLMMLLAGLDINPGFYRWLIVIEGAMMSVVSAVYLIEMTVSLRIIKLFENAAFWMAIGILFYFFCLIAINWVYNHYWDEHQFQTANLVYSFNNYALIFSSVCFIKAILCRNNFQ
ncbi:MAG: hypothetical protein P4L51_01810 [Puia sp.]|nr:hypothetical protein [Puia sp.]